MQDKDLERYSRHILLPEIEFEGQKKLLQSHCLIIGAGGLGSPVAIYLAASGIGKITICDFDDVDLSNLQRRNRGFNINLARGGFKNIYCN